MLRLRVLRYDPDLGYPPGTYVIWEDETIRIHQVNMAHGIPIDFENSTEGSATREPPQARSTASSASESEPHLWGANAGSEGAPRKKRTPGGLQPLLRTQVPMWHQAPPTPPP